jgi:arginase
VDRPGRDRDRVTGGRHAGSVASFAPVNEICILGVPTSAGAFAPGQECAPRALREAGLAEALKAAGHTVVDRGDREVWRWRPDRQDRRAQNVGKVVEIVRETAGRVAETVEAGQLPLVLGGDCTIGIGTVAGLAPGTGLLYLDSHADLNVPSSVHEGALDWMGLAHMLGLEGARRELVEAGGRTPMLTPDGVTLVGWGPEQATGFERERIAELGLEVFEVDAVAEDPAGVAARAVASLEERCDRIAVHCDVDLVDFTDTPLSENWGRNEGLPFESFLLTLRAALGASGLAAVTMTELNPHHTEPGGAALERLVSTIAEGLAARRPRCAERG